jgi:hypothetical protein
MPAFSSSFSTLITAFLQAFSHFLTFANPASPPGVQTFAHIGHTVSLLLPLCQYCFQRPCPRLRTPQWQFQRSRSTGGARR